MSRLLVPIIVIYMLFSIAGCQPQKPSDDAAVNSSNAVQTENQALTVTCDYTAWKVQAEYDEEFFTQNMDAISAEETTSLVIKDLSAYNLLLESLNIEKNADIDEGYFKKNTLLAIFPKLHSSTVDYEVVRAYIEADTAKLEISKLIPAEMTDDLTFEGILVSLDNEELGSTNSFDIYTNTRMVNNNDEKNSLTMEDLQLGQLKLRMSSEEVTEALQAHPLQVIMEQNGLLEKRFYDGIELQLLSGEVSYISTSSDQYVTPRGLKVGDSVEELIELYGTPSQIYNNIYSFDFSDEYYLFHAEVKDGKIVRIQVNLAC